MIIKRKKKEENYFENVLNQNNQNQIQNYK